MVLTDIDALLRFMTVQGVISFTEQDDTGADSQTASECIEFSIAYLKGRLAAKYPPNLLANSPILREWATVIAARTLCTRRGNPIPDSLEMRYQEIIALNGLLDQVFHSVIALIDDAGNVITGKASSAPVMSNLRVDRRYPNERIRVVRQTSRPVTTQLERDFASDVGGFLDG